MTSSSKKSFYVSQKAVIVAADGTMLALRRSSTAPSRPLFWDLPGGQLDFGEDPKAGIVREIQEESGIDVYDVTVLDALSKISEIDGRFWVTIAYNAHTHSKNVMLSFEHDEYQWIPPSEFSSLQASTRNKKIVRAYISKNELGI